MSTAIMLAAWLSILAGLAFFTTSAVGLIRFPDLYTRLHAVTKADTLGLGLLAAGLALYQAEAGAAAMLALIWLIVLASTATSCQLLARYQCEHEEATADEEGEE